MSSRFHAITFDVASPEVVAAFWAGLLGREVVPDAGGRLLPGSPTQVGLRFEANPDPPEAEERVHLHVTSSSPEDQQRVIATALDLGASHLDVGQLPEEGHVVLADPAGDPFCVIEPGNNFLAGCGLLGELACDGTREVGLFWAAALGWPLVWDENEETAVQAPEGGTKVAWGGPPVAPQHGRSRQRFELMADDAGGLAAEVERLVGLGATVLREGDGEVALADVDGTEFRIRPLS